MAREKNSTKKNTITDQSPIYLYARRTRLYNRNCAPHSHRSNLQSRQKQQSQRTLDDRNQHGASDTSFHLSILPVLFPPAALATTAEWLSRLHGHVFAVYEMSESSRRRAHTSSEIEWSLMYQQSGTPSEATRQLARQHRQAMQCFSTPDSSVRRLLIAWKEKMLWPAKFTNHPSDLPTYSDPALPAPKYSAAPLSSGSRGRRRPSLRKLQPYLRQIIPHRLHFFGGTM